MSTDESTTAQPSLTASTDDATQIPEFFKPGHVVQIPLRTLQDVANAKKWLEAVDSQTRPVLSDFELTFRALYDKLDGTTTIRILRKLHHHAPLVDPERSLVTCLGIRNLDYRVPARLLNMYNEVAKDGDAWIAHLWTAQSFDLQNGGYAWLEYYNFFKNIALRKEGKDWTVADLASVIEFIASRRGFRPEGVVLDPNCARNGTRSST